MSARPLKDRLLFDLNDVRNELNEMVRQLAPEDFGWSPRPAKHMKTFEAHLREVCAMEMLVLSWIVGQEALTWDQAQARIAWTGGSADAALADLSRIRAVTLAYLETAAEESMAAMVPVGNGWSKDFGADELEQEEFFRWIIRHEYYHLGQMIIYRWIQGHNPYEAA